MAKLPKPRIPEERELPKLPFNGSAVSPMKFAFSFVCFDRQHPLFNLGDEGKEGVVSGRWFIDLMDCLKSVNGMTIPELRHSPHELHPVKWNSANAKPPEGSEQYDYEQFRLNKSRGRVIGILLDGVFYVVWLDPHHNLTDSEGYEPAKKYRQPKSEYEQLCDRVKELENDIETYKQLFDDTAIKQLSSAKKSSE